MIKQEDSPAAGFVKRWPAGDPHRRRQGTPPSAGGDLSRFRRAGRTQRKKTITEDGIQSSSVEPVSKCHWPLPFIAIFVPAVRCLSRDYLCQAIRPVSYLSRTSVAYITTGQPPERETIRKVGTRRGRVWTICQILSILCLRLLYSRRNRRRFPLIFQKLVSINL